MMYAAKYRSVINGYIIPFQKKKFRHDLQRRRRDQHGGRQCYDERAAALIPFIRSHMQESLLEDDPFLAEDLELLALDIVGEYMNLTYDKIHLALPPFIAINTWNTIQNIPPSECSARFRLDTTLKIQELFRCLKVLPRYKLSNGSYIAGEELFLYSLHRLSSVGTTVTNQLSIWGRDEPFWSRGWRCFLKWLFDAWNFKLYNNLPYFVARFSLYALKIGDLCDAVLGPNLPFNGSCMICCFIDCNNCHTNRQGGGPVHPGAGAARHAQHVQQVLRLII